MLDKVENLVDFISGDEESENLYGDYITNQIEHLSLEMKMEEVSEKVISRIDETIVADFDYSDESLDSIENIVSEGFLETEQLEEELLDDLIMDLGAYLGLTIIKNLGGIWRFRKNYLHSSIYFPAINAECFPFHRVTRRLLKGRAESLSDFYLSLIQVLGAD